MDPETAFHSGDEGGFGGPIVLRRLMTASMRTKGTTTTPSLSPITNSGFDAQATDHDWQIDGAGAVLNRRGRGYTGGEAWQANLADPRDVPHTPISDEGDSTEITRHAEDKIPHHCGLSITVSGSTITSPA